MQYWNNNKNEWNAGMNEDGSFIGQYGRKGLWFNFVSAVQQQIQQIYPNRIESNRTKPRPSTTTTTTARTTRTTAAAAAAEINSAQNSKWKSKFFFKLIFSATS